MSVQSFNGIEFIASCLSFEVLGFKEKPDCLFYFQLQVYFNLQQHSKKLTFECTYLQLFQLQNDLQLQCYDIPTLSSDSSIPKTKDIEKQKLRVEKWLNAIAWRPDIIATSTFQNFFHIQQLLPVKDWLEQPQHSVKISQNHDFPVVDFHYEPDPQVIFILTSDQSILSKVEGIFSLVTGKQDKIRSQLIAYQLDVDDQQNPVCQQLWTLNFTIKASSLFWDDKLTILSVGFENGNITCFRVLTEKKFKEQYEFCSIIKHTNAIISVRSNYLAGFLYSLSKDKLLISTDLQNPGNTTKDIEFDDEPTCMLDDFENKRLLAADSRGTVSILNYLEGPLIPIHQIRTNHKMHIISMQYASKYNYLICGGKSGQIIIIELGKKGKERLSNVISSLETVPNLRNLYLNFSTKEFYVNYQNSILVMDSQKIKYKFSLEAHEAQITKFQLFEDLGVMITASRDKCVKFWQYKYFPHLTIEQEIEPFKNTKIEIIKQQEESKQQFQQKDPLHLTPEIEDLDDWTS